MKANFSVVLSNSAWKRLFGADPSVIGRSIQLNGSSYKIVGVMPPDFRWPRQVDVWTPLALPTGADAEDNRFNEGYFGVARMKQGVSLGQANALLAVLSDRVRSGTQNGTYAKNSGWGMFGVSFSQYDAGDNRMPVIILLVSVGFVLLIACSNIAGLMLARNAERVREIAVRGALGANRWQLMRSSFAESGLLAALGGISGLALASVALRLLVRYGPDATGLNADLDWRMLAFSAVITMLAGCLFSVGATWAVSRVEANEVLKQSGRSRIGGKPQGRAPEKYWSSARRHSLSYFWRAPDCSIGVWPIWGQFALGSTAPEC